MLFRGWGGARPTAAAGKKVQEHVIKALIVIVTVPNCVPFRPVDEYDRVNVPIGRPISRHRRDHTPRDLADASVTASAM